MKNQHFAPSWPPRWSLARAIRDPPGALLAPKQFQKNTCLQQRWTKNSKSRPLGLIKELPFSPCSHRFVSNFQKTQKCSIWTPTGLYAAHKKEFPFWEASKNAIFYWFFGFLVSPFWWVFVGISYRKVDQNVPGDQGKDPPEAHLCSSSGGLQKKEKRMYKRQ